MSCRSARLSALLIAGMVCVLGARQARAQGTHHAPDAPDAPDAADTPQSLEANQGWTQTLPSPKTASMLRVPDAQLRVSAARSAEELLRHVPGLLIVQHGAEGKGYQLYLRGFDAAHGSDVEVTLEGLPLNEPANVHAHGYLDLGLIIPELVMALDVTKGPFEVAQGDLATAASVHYRLGVAPDRRGASVLAQVGSTGRARVVGVWAPPSGAASEVLGVEAMHDEGFGPRRRAQRVSALGQTRLRLAPGLSLELLGAAYAARFELPGAMRLEDGRAGRRGFLDVYSSLGQGSSKRAIGRARLVRELGPGQRLTLELWAQPRALTLREDFTGYLRDDVHGDLLEQAQTSRYGGAQLSYTARCSPQLSAQTTLAWRPSRVWARERPLDRALAPVTSSSSPDWAGLSRDHELDRDQLSWTLMAQGSPWRWAALEGGLRVDAFADRALDRAADRQVSASPLLASPRLSARAFPTPTWTIFASAGQGLRSPDVRALLRQSSGSPDEDLSRFRGGSPQITASQVAELGAQWEPGPALRVSAALFGARVEREVVYDHVSATNLELNGTRRLGAELSAQATPARWLVLGADMTLVRARFVPSDNPIPSVPTALATARAELHLARLGVEAGLHWTYVGPRPLPFGALASPMSVGMASAAWRWRALEVSLQVENLLDAPWRAAEYAFASWWDRAQARSQLPALHYVAGSPRQARLGLRLYF